MADDNRDILMKLEMTPNKYVPSECSGVVSGADKLAAGFQGTSQTGSLVRGNYFSIEDFEFDIGLAEKGPADAMKAQEAQAEEKVNQVTKGVNQALSTVGDHIRTLHERIDDLEARLAELTGGKRSGSGGGVGGADLVGDIEVSGSKEAGAYSRFMTDGRAFQRRNANAAYPSDLEPVSVSKRMDASSTTLFNCCKTSLKFTSATILKRRAVGGAMLRGFLRLDFYDVMLTELNWDDDEVIRESFKFVCRRAVVQYAMETGSRSQFNPEAAVLKPMPAVEWNVLNTK